MQERGGGMDGIRCPHGRDSSPKAGGFPQNVLRDRYQTCIRLMPEVFPARGKRSISLTKRHYKGFHERQFAGDNRDDTRLP